MAQGVCAMDAIREKGTFRKLRQTKQMILFAALLTAGTIAAPVQAQRHTYPLIGWQSFGGAIVDYYSRFDLIISRHTDVRWAQEMKRRNPDVLLVPTYDWNSAQSPFIPNFPEEWWLKKSNGDYVYAYGTYKMANLSDMCPRAKSGPMAGMTYAEYLPIFLTELVDLSVFDGLATDGAWGHSEMYWMYNRPQFADVDIDANGVNDKQQMSKDAWLERWQNGMDTILNGLRARMPEGKLLIVNSGNYHNWGWEAQNGIIVEKLYGYFDDKFTYDYFQKFRAGKNIDFVTVADGLPYKTYPGLPERTKDDFQGMLFGLVTSMFNDVYFSFQNVEAGEHYWSHWYDEFELDLGMPIGPPKEIRTGLWVRFFQKGVAIANSNGQDHVATDADLRRFSEYSGPYYRFRGGQNPDYNNGAQFTSVELQGMKLDNRYFGDGIILLNQPRTVIADIIIDNSDSGTSPGSDPAELRNGFQQSQDCGNDGYTVRCSGWLNTYRTAEANPGSARAIFRPTIGVAGLYDVYEWHPALSGGATKVIHYVVSKDGQKSFVVNQQQNSGRWNKLGTFYFERGSNGRVEISANGADGVVAADAIKFVYVGEDADRDTTPPDTPRGVKVKIENQ